MKCARRKGWRRERQRVKVHSPDRNGKVGFLAHIGRVGTQYPTSKLGFIWKPWPSMKKDGKDATERKQLQRLKKRNITCVRGTCGKTAGRQQVQNGLLSPKLEYGHEGLDYLRSQPCAEKNDLHRSSRCKTCSVTHSYGTTAPKLGLLDSLASKNEHESPAEDELLDLMEALPQTSNFQEKSTRTLIKWELVPVGTSELVAERV